MEFFNILNPKSWLHGVCEAQWNNDESKQLNKIIKFTFSINDLRAFVDNRDIKQKNIPSSISTAKRMLNVIAVNSAEAKIGFSTMNNINDVKRN